MRADGNSVTPVILGLLSYAPMSGYDMKQAVDRSTRFFWAASYGQITDPFGHRWGLAQHLRDVPREELERAVAEAFGG